MASTVVTVRRVPGIMGHTQVSPSDRGHSGAGGFAGDLVAIAPHDGAQVDLRVEGPRWLRRRPAARGWAAAAPRNPRYSDTIEGRRNSVSGGQTAY